jgi:hypothetical protein
MSATQPMARQASARRWLGALEQPHPSGWREPAIALVIACAYLLLLLGTVKDLGYARDEGFYFQAARAYQGWFEQLWREPAVALARVDSVWRNNSEHPGLMKSLFALSNLLFYQRWHLFALEGTSFRFPAMVLSGLGIGLVYLWGARACGRLCGLGAALGLGFMPRFFFQAHLACFDAPVVTMWTLCAYCYWRALARGGWLWPIAVGLSFGLALDTKHNSWFLPLACGLHALLLELGTWLSRYGRGAKQPAGAGGAGDERSRDLDSDERLRVTLRRRRSLAALGGMALLGPPVFYALWPWIWHDTVKRLTVYARFHLEHVYYNMEFLGRNYWTPPMPRSYAFVMTAATVPAITLLLFAIGLWASGRVELRPLGASLRGVVARLAGRPRRAEDERKHAELEPGTALLWLLAMAVQYAAWLSPKTPIFGGTKHWMTAYPFLTLFAGVGLVAVVRAARKAWEPGAPVPLALRRLAAGPGLELGFAAAVLAAPVVETLHVHPWGLSSYSPLVGGAAGGASLGLNRSFWGYTTGAVTGYLNATAKRGARVYVHDTASPAWDMLYSDGRLRRDIRGVGSVAGADFGLYHHEMHMQGQEYQNWVAFGTVRPDQIAGLDGVPVIWVYRQPGAQRAGTPATGAGAR